MNILGISGGVSFGNQDGSAALLVDGKLIAAAEEERFVGIKFANGHLPRSAIAYVLREANLTMADVDTIVFAGSTYIEIADILRRFLVAQFGHAPNIKLVDHHEAHAASSFYGWGAKESLVVTWDNSGDGKCTTIWSGSQGKMTLLHEYRRPNSLGLFYGAVTQYLGFMRDSDEYKVMGMAAYGQQIYDFDPILEVTSDGYHFHSDFIQGIVPGRPQPTKFIGLFDEFPLAVPRRLPTDPFTETHFNVAASAQAQLERACVTLVRHWLAKTGHRRVCFAGGVALNCLMNQKIREMDGVDEIFVPPVCSDAGLALGAAYLEAIAQGEQISPLGHAYWGPSFSSAEIKRVLDRAGARYRVSRNAAEDAASIIEQGKILGWFQGRLEYGPRALGCRSILANPRVADMKDIINMRVKFREEYRPLAPAILHERGSDFFDNYTDSPYMTQTFRTKGNLAEIAPAVVHADGTARLQSVHASTNPRFAELIHELQKKIDLPITLNTSLNAYNDPMACSPHQALRTFFTTGMDALILEEFVLEK
jgi:carbamoyltransferase